MPCCEKRNLYEMLVFFHNTVHEHIDVHGKGFWYSLVFGTMIGSLRNADLVDWDEDIDIVVPKAHMPWLIGKLQDAAKKSTPPYILKGPSMYHDLAPMYRLQLSQANDAHIDIWVGDHFDTDHPPPCVLIGTIAYPTAISFPLQKCNIQGSSFPCFAEGSKYLEYKYGKDWKVPDTNKEPKENGGHAKENGGIPLPFMCKNPYADDPLAELIGLDQLMLELDAGDQPPYSYKGGIERLDAVIQAAARNASSTSGKDQSSFIEDPGKTRRGPGKTLSAVISADGPTAVGAAKKSPPSGTLRQEPPPN